MHEVFVSYSSKNSQLAMEAVSLLEYNGISCWIAERDIRIGSNYATDIPPAIRNCQYVLLLLTEESQQSPWVQRELDVAITLQKTVLPVKIGNFAISDTLFFLLKFIQFDDGTEDYLYKLQNVVRYIWNARGYSCQPPAQSDQQTWQAVSHSNSTVRPSPKRPTWLIPVIAGAAAVIVLLAVLLGGNADHKDPISANTPSDTRTPSDASTAASTDTEASVLAQSNTLMENPCAKNAEGVDNLATEIDDLIFGTNITRRQVGTITFLDSLTDAPADAADASALGNGKVKAWTIYFRTVNAVIEEDPANETTPTTMATTDLYHLYIAADGGVWAPANSHFLFAAMPNLVSIDFGNAFHTENAENMHCMFSMNKSMETLDLSCFDTSAVSSMRGMFYLCSKLETVTISSFNTEKVRDFSHMFNHCGSLKELDLNHFETPAAKDMSAMFTDCASLETLTVSNFDTEKISDFSSMFRECSSLKELNLASFKTANAESMSCMFYKCNALTDLSISGFNTEKVKDFSHMFRDCTSLTELELSHFRTPAAESMTYMFAACHSLKKLSIPNFNTEQVKNFSFMFYECSSLENTLNLSHFRTSAAENMKGMFMRCAHADKLDLSLFDTSKVTSSEYFMDDGITVNGQPWTALFE